LFGERAPPLLSWGGYPRGTLATKGLERIQGGGKGP